MVKNIWKGNKKPIIKENTMAKRERTNNDLQNTTLKIEQHKPTKFQGRNQVLRICLQFLYR